MRNFLLCITREDMATGEPGVCSNCAAAVALRRCLPGARVVVWGDRYVVNGRPYPSPAGLRQFVAEYDRVGKIDGAGYPEPLSLVLPVEDGVTVGSDWEVAA